MARQSDCDETEVAIRALAAAKRAGARPGDHHTACRESDPGYYLIAKGRHAFEKELGCRVPIRTRLFRLNSNIGVMSYVGMIAIVTAVVMATALLATSHAGFNNWMILLLLAIAGMVPASDVAVAVVNRAITRGVGAMLLPGLEFRQGIPADSRTIIVVPTMLASIPEIRDQVKRLEVHYLSNPDENLVFAILSDWRDSETEHDANDEPLVAEAAAGIAELNARHAGAAGRDPFYLLHRRRLWNAGEGKWIGWERKRGKLHELNRLLRGATDTSFLTTDSRAALPPSGIRYVITLDSDTRLPIGAARRLVGKLAHPLNRPQFDPESGVVIHGHGILQPRVTPSLPVGDEGSLYQRVFSGPDGLDPYALAVSDVYQDLFEEGSYSGKGIYDIDVFETALGRADSGEYRSQPRSSRGHIHARRSRHRYRSGRGISLPLQRRRRASASLGTRRLAVAAMDIRLWPQNARRRDENRHPADGALEAARQSAPFALCSGRSSDFPHRLAATRSGRRDMDVLRRGDDCAAAAHPGHCRNDAPAREHLPAQSLSRAAP